jgi:hypothetical protein
MEQLQAEHVREFTAGAGQPTPDRPELMTAEEVHFITKMIIDETLELWATLFTSDEAVAAMVEIIETAKKLPKEVFSDDEQGHIDQVAAQADALVDIEYYMLNCAAKKGINMSAIFGVVRRHLQLCLLSFARVAAIGVVSLTCARLAGACSEHGEAQPSHRQVREACRRQDHQASRVAGAGC